MSLRIIALGAAALAFCAPASSMADPGKPGTAHQAGMNHAGHGKAQARHGKAARPYNRAGSDNRHAGHACPPGLAKKYPGCIPPGQWKKGYRIPAGWSGHYVQYDRLPDYYRNRYAVNPGYRYLYQDDRVLVVDAVTRTIVDVILR